VPGQLTIVVRELRAYPKQFWILVVGIFIYVSGAALGFPYEAIYLHSILHISTTWIGAIFGLVPIAVMPFQIWGGALTDRFGRRWMLILSTVAGVVWFIGFAYSRHVWQVAALTAVECAFGWPLFQTASNAMVADLLPPEDRAEAFSVTRVSMNLGVVVGPAFGALALSLHASFRQLFLAAAVGCALFVAVAALWLRESKPVVADGVPEHVDEGGRRGFAIVRADRRFLVFCAAALLPVICIGQFGSIFAMYITDTVGVPFRTWGLLLMMNAFIVATMQYPLVRRLRRKNAMLLLSLASLLLGLGMGGAALATGVVWLVLWVAVISFGEIFLSPVTATVVSDLAPEEVRGRYMSVWTVVWNGGASFGVLIGGLSLQHIGGRQTFAAAMAFGVAGAVSFAFLARGWRPRRRAFVRPVP
jgi:MFS family permease